MGWLALGGFGLAAMAALALLGLARPLYSMVGAALMLGGAGYAWQGSPALPDKPATPIAAAAPDDAPTATLRDQMFGGGPAEIQVLHAADALGRSGDRRAAVAALLDGLRARPQSAALWTALGGALAAHDGQQLSPTALYAFQQAARLAPGHPGPYYFLGLADLQAGDPADAESSWRRALAMTPPNAPYREEIADRLALLERELGAGPAAPPRGP